MNNAEWMIKQGYKFRELTCKCSKTGNCDYDILLNNKCVGKVKDSYSNEAITTWLDMEHNELILDEAEKQYLSAVIKPFRDRMLTIAKLHEDTGEYFIELRLCTNGREQTIDFPYFYGGMYEGMEDNVWYTLKTLGL